MMNDHNKLNFTYQKNQLAILSRATLQFRIRLVAIIVYPVLLSVSLMILTLLTKYSLTYITTTVAIEIFFLQLFKIHSIYAASVSLFSQLHIYCSRGIASHCSRCTSSLCSRCFASHCSRCFASHCSRCTASLHQYLIICHLKNTRRGFQIYLLEA